MRKLNLLFTLAFILIALLIVIAIAAMIGGAG